MTETNRLEFKAKLTDDFEKEVVAFLNYREGGVLYIATENPQILKILTSCNSK